MTDSHKPRRIISSMAPVRIADFGGWTDTWFAQHGRVLNFAVDPCAEVQIEVSRRTEQKPAVHIHAENYGERYALENIDGTYDRHPLLEAALDYMHVPEHLALEITIFSEMPVGCSTGTSAAVSVALIGALDRLTPGQLTPGEVARCAHRIETDLLKQQCGVQDQLAAAYGGVNFIEILDYPHSIVSPIRLPESMHWELQRRLSLIYVGQSHSSSKVHESVIRRLEDAGPDAAELAPLREIPLRVRDALYGGDFPALARAMIENTDAQANLHPDLLSPRHAAVIDVARQNGAIGWKLNGAGGDGGSVTLLSGPDTAERRGMLREIEAALPECRSIPILLSPLGLRTWDTPVEGLHGPRFVI